MLPVQLSPTQTVIARSDAHGIAAAAGPTVPANGAVGYSPGCVFVLLSSAAAKTAGVYLNTGTRNSAAFKPLTLQTEGALIIPVADENGRDLLPQVTGSMCWNTTSGALSCYNGSAWEEYAAA